MSGGEPARQFKFSYNFLKACKELDIHTAVETTGYARWEVMATLASVTDLFLYDVKLMDSDAHGHYVGVSNDVILNNLRRLARLGNEIHIRVPCIPGINDGEEQIRSTAAFVAAEGIETIALLPYNGAAGAKYQWIGSEFALADKKTQSDEYMASLADICREEGLFVQVGG